MSDIAGWGMGVSTDDNGEYICYGFPIDLNAENFSPDIEMCSQEEIEKHKADLAKRLNIRKEYRADCSRNIYTLFMLPNMEIKHAWDIIFEYFTHE